MLYNIKIAIFAAEIKSEYLSSLAKKVYMIVRKPYSEFIKHV